MRVTLRQATSLPELMKQLGVHARDEARVADAVRAAVKHEPGGARGAEAVLPAGLVLTLADDLLTSDQARPASQGAVRGAPPHAVDVGKPLSTLGRFGIQADLSARTGKNDLGALSALGALGITGHALDRASLNVRVPLKAGTYAIPIGDKRVRIEVKPGTVLTLQATLVPREGRDPAALAVRDAQLAFSQGVTVQNPSDLSFASGKLLGSTVDALLKVELSGLTVSADGSVTPHGSISRPSLNPMKHIFASGRSAAALEDLAPLLGKARIHTDVDRLARGDVLAERNPLMAPDLPQHFDVGGLLRTFGGVAERGTFDLRLEGRAGAVDVGRGRVSLVGRDERLRATVTGTFSLHDGGVNVTAEARTRVPLEARVHFNELGAPAATLGPLQVGATGESIDIGLHGALLAEVRARAERAHVTLPSHVNARLEGDAVVHGSARLTPTPGGVVVTDGALRVVVDVSGSSARAQGLDLRLAPGSQLALEAHDVTVRGSEVMLSTAHGAFSVVAEGTARLGPLPVRVRNAASDGSASLRFDDEGRAAAAGEITYALRARPTLGRVPMPGQGTLSGSTAVVLTPDAILVTSAQKLRVTL